MDGFNHDDLLMIATRKYKVGLPMSATDINRSIPYEVSRAVTSGLDGLTEDQLKGIAERKISIMGVSPQEINEARVIQSPLMDKALSKLSDMLGIRTR